MKKKKIIIEITHDYFSVKKSKKEIQIPIIYMYEVFNKLEKSGFCTPNNVLAHSYQGKYPLDVEIWTQEEGGFKLIPEIETEQIIRKIKVERIE